MASRPWRRRSISSPRERLAFSRDETSVDPSARSSITPTQSLDSIVRGRALSISIELLERVLAHRAHVPKYGPRTPGTVVQPEDPSHVGERVRVASIQEIPVVEPQRRLECLLG